MKTTKPSTKRKSAPRASNRGNGRQWRIVGIGCSAGGLEACEQFFDQLPADTGLAFVVVSHLDPERKGILPELLQRHTRMPVVQAKDGMKALPNRVHVIPPNVDLSILHGKLELLEPAAPHGMRMPIDFFFNHLAQDQKDHSICIVLSGMGTDGTQGLKAIKAEFGLALAQDPATAKFDSMPRNAITTGLVDIVAPASDLPGKLIGFVKHATTQPPIRSVEEKPASGLEKIFVLLRARTGADFSGYKPATIYRRVERRMSVHQLQPLAHYVRYLRENPAEVDLLFRELLIGVTSFFRDPVAFEVLQGKALPALLQRHPPGTPLRVWVPGCSTGEEAYSILIALSEVLGQRQAGVPVQMFATDLGKEGIDKARQGIFAANSVAGLGRARLQRYFTRTEHGYVVKKELRERVVFAPQNLISDPPFTKLDLVCCRNLLIYINTDWQKKVLALFHYALNPGGILFLGPAETIGGLTDLFAPLDNRWKIFQRKITPASLPGLVELPSVSHGPRTPAAEKKPAARAGDVAEAAQRSLIDAYVPPAVVINKDGDIIYVVGRTGKYLEPSSGKVNLNVFAMAREGLRMELGLVIRNAVQRHAMVRVEKLRVKTNGSYQTIHLTVRPLAAVPGAEELLLVVFEDAESEVRDRQPRLALRANALTKAIKRELQHTQAQLQSTLEDGVATQEELRAANEELQSNNEELQSSNEELMTSKEEMQSLNEEMTTVNAELQAKLDEVAQVNNDMKNLLNGIDVATIFADNELRIKRFTAQATRIINLIPGDVGRPLRDLVTKLQYDGLVDDAKTVLATLVFKEAQIQTTDRHWFLMRIVPYRTTDNVIDGVVFTFTEVTALKELEASLRDSQAAHEEARLLAESIIATVREPLLVLDSDLRILSTNRAYCEVFRAKPEQTERSLFYKVGNGQWDIPDLRRLLGEVLPRQTTMHDFRVTHEFPGIGLKIMLLNARQVQRPGQRPPLILLAFEDITGRKGSP